MGILQDDNDSVISLSTQCDLFLFDKQAIAAANYKTGVPTSLP